MATERDNLKAGLFVIAAIVIALVIVFPLADLGRLFEVNKQWQVFYQLSDGLKGLKEGGPVTLGGEPTGEVIRIEDLIESTSQGERVIGKTVTISIPARTQLFQNAVIELLVPTLGSGTKLNIRNVGQGAPHDPEKPIQGQLSSSDLTRDLVRDVGIQEEQRQQIRNIIAHMETITATLKDDLPQITGKVKNILTDTEPLAKNAKDALADLKLALDDVNGLTADVRKRSSLWFDRVDSSTESLGQTLSTARDLVKDKAPDIRASIENIKAVTQVLKDENLDQLRDALSSAQEALRKVKKTTDELSAFIVGHRPVLERMLANLQVTAGQLKLAAIEVRRSPWRLIYQPKEKELETDNLYDASRSFALAAEVLDVTAASLEHVSQQTPNDAEQIEKMIDYLEKIFLRFQKAETAFWQALERHGPGE